MNILRTNVLFGLLFAATMGNFVYAGKDMAEFRASLNDRLGKAKEHVGSNASLIVVPVLGGYALREAGYNKLASASEEAAVVASAAAVLGLPVNYALASDVILQAATYQFEGNKTFANLVEKAPKADSKEGRSAYRVGTSLALSYLLNMVAGSVKSAASTSGNA